MAFIIAQPCVGKKRADCVRVCPVDAIHPQPGSLAFHEAAQLHINAETCIECGSCARVCDSKAVFSPDTLPAEWSEFGPRNVAYFQQGAA